MRYSEVGGGGVFRNTEWAVSVILVGRIRGEYVFKVLEIFWKPECAEVLGAFGSGGLLIFVVERSCNRMMRVVNLHHNQQLVRTPT